MRKILLGFVTTGAVAAVALVATNAFFSDTETSEGNTLQAGAIDLKVDNTCYYNGRACTLGHFEGTDIACDCTWEPEDLTNESLFFNLADIKPGDWEEDTISLQVVNNESWLCAQVHLTSDDDVDCSEPENEAEGPNVCQNSLPAANSDGDLADEVRFLWWADDGDNVLERDETPLPAGPLGALNVSQTATVTLADSLFNIWGLTGPIPQGGNTFYLGKSWCYGTISAAPVPADRGTANTADDDNGPNTPTNAGDQVLVTPEDGGVTCDGSGIGNESQTDKLTADISFIATQARNNSDFVCSELAP